MLRIWLMKFASSPVIPSCVFQYAYLHGAEKSVRFSCRLMCIGTPFFVLKGLVLLVTKGGPAERP